MAEAAKFRYRVLFSIVSNYLFEFKLGEHYRGRFHRERLVRRRIPPVARCIGFSRDPEVYCFSRAGAAVASGVTGGLERFDFGTGFDAAAGLPF